MSIKTDWVMCVHDKRVVDCKPCYDMTQVAVDPWREMVRTLRARVAELEAERDEWKASATTLKNLAGLATSTLEAERDARIPVSWIRERATKWRAQDDHDFADIVDDLADAWERQKKGGKE